MRATLFPILVSRIRNSLRALIKANLFLITTSADGNGMYFDFYMNDLEKDTVYELEFLIRENDQDFYINDSGFRFKVTV